MSEHSGRRMFRVLGVLAALLAFAPVLSARAQDVTVQTFGEALARFEEHRGQLLSYIAKVDVVEYGTESAVGETWRFLDRRSYEVVADITRDSIFMTRNSSPAYANSSTTNYSSLLLKHGPQFYLASAGTLSKKNLMRDGAGFLDPQVIGLGFCAETRRFIEFDMVIANYRSWPTANWELQRKDGDLVFTSGGNGEAFGKKVVFSSRQGFAPTLLEIREGVGVRVNCRYVERDGVWLPSVAKYECGGSRNMIMTVDWCEINCAISEELFTPAKIAELSGLKVRFE